MRRFIPLILLIAMIVTIVHSTEPVYALEAYIRNGDIVFYGSTNNLSTAHSAICVEPSVTSNAIKYVHCISKWGSLGVFMHDMSSVPAAYDTSTISTWRLS